MFETIPSAPKTSNTYDDFINMFLDYFHFFDPDCKNTQN